MPAPTDYDVVIIGSGAGGGTLARALAPSGLSVLVLERGGYIPRECDNWDTRAVFDDKRYQARETWFDADDRPFDPYTHYCVGGNTKMYGAALLRLRESDFRGAAHAGGTSPGWPLAYPDLEPFYLRAEHFYDVHGQRGLDPCEPPASGPFPHPALEPEPRIRELMADLTALGCRPFPIPLAVRPSRDRAPDADYRFARFDGYPDPTEVKADAHVAGVRPATREGRVTVLTHALVDRLDTDDSGRRVTAVRVRRPDETLTFRGRVVVLAAGAVNSAAILLRSSSRTHPRGLANTSDQVGRNFMRHQNGCLLAVCDAPNPSLFQKHFGITDFYHASPASPFPLGTIQLMGKPDPSTVEWLRAGRLPELSTHDILARSIDFFLTAEDLPDPDNRVSLRPDGSIRVAYRPNNTAAYDHLQLEIERLLTLAEKRRARPRPVFLASRLGDSGVSHQCGTLRMGRDPRTSVVDPDGRCHDLDNLYVADTSVFPASGAVNPSLTAMALAIRLGETLRRRLSGAPIPHLQEAFT